MPWSTPTLKQVRIQTRDFVLTQLGAKAMIPNSVLRIMSDAMSGLAHLVLLYLDWLAKQLLPDTAETEWLDRHGDIWLVNADGSKGRKAATYAKGEVAFTGVTGAVVPAGTLMSAASSLQYQTTTWATIGDGGSTAQAICLTAGIAGNLPSGQSVSIAVPPLGVDGGATLYGNMDGGTDTETDDELRERILRRIQQPPMGGDKDDYEQWALQVPGVTRAWCAPQEMGVGTVTVRFLMDDLRADNDGWPTQDDVDVVQAYIDSKRPVTVEDCWVLAPIKQPVDWTLTNLVNDTPAVRGAIEQSVRDMLLVQAAPGQTIFAAWKSYAVMNTQAVISFDLVNDSDDVMQSPGHMAVLGSIIFDHSA